MDGPGINQKIRYGYAKAALKLGQNYQLYRSASGLDPLNIANLIGTLKMVPTQDWTWMKANRPGNAIWYCCIDGQDSSNPLSAHEMDYLVADQIFYVLSKQYQLPIQLVECNSTVNVTRPNQSVSPGLQGYGGRLPSTDTVLMTSVPCSILLQGRGSMAPSKLPTDTQQPLWIIMIPKLDAIDIRTGDILTDTTKQQYVCSATEETEFGWRLTARQTTN